jgi:heme-degrading monooxygenase HmoA
MSYFVTHFTVADFDMFCRGFAAGAPARKANGSRRARLFRSESRPNEVIALFEWDDLEKSRQFLQSPELGERLQQAGVIGRPERYEEEGAFPE